MAQKGGNGSGKVSGKVRFIMLEADIYDGNVNEIMQAIAGAVRPANVIQQILPASQPPRETPSLPGNNGTTPNLSPDSDMEATETEDSAPTSTATRRPRDESPRPIPQPKPINGIKWSGDGTVFKEYATSKKQTSHIKRFLVIAAWFRLHNETPAISLAHVYTAYGMANWRWETDKDMAQHFREGMRAKRGWYEGDGKGNYSITDLGINAANEMDGAKGEED